MPISKALTIKEIARKAGVSTQTVSRVLNDRPDVSRETRKRVQQIIDESGYHPNAIARSLIRQRTYILGLIASHLNFHGPQAHLVQLDREATEVGYTLLPQLIHENDSIDLQQQLRRLLSQQVDGIIWAIPQVDVDTSTLWEQMVLPSMPMISLEDPIPNIPMPAYVDEQTGARLATQHLLSQGYRRIGLITGATNWEVSKKRAFGWRETLQASGFPVEEQHIFQGDWTAASGEQGMYRLLEQYPGIDAVFACNDQMALGALQALHEIGRRVPDDFGVVGFDDFPESAYFWPPLSTVRQPWPEKCAIAVRALIRMIEERREGDNFAVPKTKVLLPELIVRKSSVRLD
jgi:LacI family transcriptional regulator